MQCVESEQLAAIGCQSTPLSKCGSVRQSLNTESPAPAKTVVEITANVPTTAAIAAAAAPAIQGAALLFKVCARKDDAVFLSCNAERYRAVHLHENGAHFLLEEFWHRNGYDVESWNEPRNVALSAEIGKGYDEALSAFAVERKFGEVAGEDQRSCRPAFFNADSSRAGDPAAQGKRVVTGFDGIQSIGGRSRRRSRPGKNDIGRHQNSAWLEMHRIVDSIAHAARGDKKRKNR